MVKNQMSQCPKCHTDIRNDVKSKHTQSICERNLMRHFYSETACPFKCSKWTDKSNVSRHLKTCRLNPNSPKFQGEKIQEMEIFKYPVYKQTILLTADLNIVKSPTKKHECTQIQHADQPLIIQEESIKENDLPLSTETIEEKIQVVDGCKKRRKPLKKVSAFQKIRDEKVKTYRWYRKNVLGLTREQAEFRKRQFFGYGDTKCFICFERMNFCIPDDGRERVMSCEICNKNTHAKCIYKSTKRICPHCRGKMRPTPQISNQMKKINNRLDEQWRLMTEEEQSPFYIKSHQRFKKLTPQECDLDRQLGKGNRFIDGFSIFCETRFVEQMDKFYA